MMQSERRSWEVSDSEEEEVPRVSEEGFMARDFEEERVTIKHTLHEDDEIERKKRDKNRKKRENKKTKKKAATASQD
ncbi:hypothetical protein Tco_0677791 [Tanacetum coccineum]|uniref:Uncharacterized protein n=1 Tax=Tanacetum coccineum TaxID=301880 RepID=A0ABQ4XD69_9ASTR